MPPIHLLAALALAASPAPLLKPADTQPPGFGPRTGNPLAVDLNVDGKADLVVPADKQLFALLGDGRTFRPAPGSPLPLPAGGSESVSSDFNADGKPDVALADHDVYDVTVLLGDGTGRLTPAPGSPFAARRGQRPHMHGLAAGDFDNDGDVDLVTCNSNDNDVSLLLNDGMGRFRIPPRSPFPCGPSPYPFAVADLNRDGNLDVLVPNAVHHDRNVRTLTVLLGDGKGGLAEARGSPVRLSGPAFFAAAGELMEDFWPDVVVTYDEVPGASILLNDGRGALAPSLDSPLKLDHSCWCAEITDMNGDGRNDVVLAGGDAVRVFLGDGNGRLAPAPGSPFRTGKGTWRFCVADFNGDRKPDVLTKCVEEEGKLVILLGQ